MFTKGPTTLTTGAHPPEAVETSCGVQIQVVPVTAMMVAGRRC